MGQLNQDPEDFMRGMATYRNQLATRRANLFGKAGQLDDPALGEQDYGLISPIYKPGGDLFVAGQKGRSPPAAAAASSAPAAKPLSDSAKAQAQELIKRDGRDAVISHLKAGGYDTSGL